MAREMVDLAATYRRLSISRIRYQPYVQELWVQRTVSLPYRPFLILLSTIIIILFGSDCNSRPNRANDRVPSVTNGIFTIFDLSDMLSSHWSQTPERSHSYCLPFLYVYISLKLLCFDNYMNRKRSYLPRHYKNTTRSSPVCTLKSALVLVVGHQTSLRDTISEAIHCHLYHYHHIFQYCGLRSTGHFPQRLGTLLFPDRQLSGHIGMWFPLPCLMLVLYCFS